MPKHPDFLFTLFFYMLFNGGKGFVADGMLQPASILGSSLGINAQADEHIAQHGVPLVYFLCDLLTIGSERNIAVFVDGNIAALF